LGLGQILSPLAIIPITLFTIIAVIPIFIQGGNATSKQLDEESLIAKIDDVQSKATSRLAAMQNMLDGMTGQDKESLAEENKQLKEQLEAIKQAERDKVLSEAEKLRRKNEDLENQIKQWAIQTVGETVVDEESTQNKAA